MASKVTPSQLVSGFAATLAVIFITTALVWKWPNASDWVFGGVVILAGVFLFFVWRSARKQEAVEKEAPPTGQK